LMSDIVSVFSDVIQVPNFLVFPPVHRPFFFYVTIGFPQTQHHFQDTSTCFIFYFVLHLLINVNLTLFWASLDRILKSWISPFTLSTAICARTFVCSADSPRISAI
jgi:hypothetical protein